MKNVKRLVLLLICLQSLTAFAQTKVYGVNAGFGRSTVVGPDMEAALVSPIQGDSEDFFQLGLDYQYAPGNSSIYFKSGLLYNARTTDNTALDYLRAPLGLDIGIGNAVQFIFGASVFTSYLLAYSGFEGDMAFNDNVRRFQFGWGGNVGLGIDLSEKLNLNMQYQQNFDLTEMYTVETVTKDGVVSDNFLGQDGFVRVGVYYKIHTR